MTTQLLLVAKAPVPGEAKTRLGAYLGHEAAAELAGAALLDTVRTCTAAVGPDRCRLALAGDLRAGAYADQLTRAVAGWMVFPQRGANLGERLACAHRDVAAAGPVVQIGMDTPQLTEDDLSHVARELEQTDAVLAHAEDGGWWELGLSDARHGERLAGVPMSTPTTARDTRRALEDVGLRVGGGPVLRDVDTVDDAETVARLCAPRSEFARAWDRRGVPVR
jgi:rSAM/selenodomain-associated transferase 1